MYQWSLTSKVRYLRFKTYDILIIKFSLFEGNVDDDTVFTYDTDTEVDASCVATLNGEFWVIGGNIKRRQVKF